MTILPNKFQLKSPTKQVNGGSSVRLISRLIVLELFYGNVSLSESVFNSIDNPYSCSGSSCAPQPSSVRGSADRPNATDHYSYSNYSLGFSPLSKPFRVPGRHLDRFYNHPRTELRSVGLSITVLLCLSLSVLTLSNSAEVS